MPIFSTTPPDEMEEPLRFARLVAVAALSFALAGCSSRSQTAQEEIAVAQRCEARHLHVAVSEGLYGLERAECVPIYEGVSPSEFIAEFRAIQSSSSDR